MFRNPNASQAPQQIELARSTDEQKQPQAQRLADFQPRLEAEAPAMLQKLKQAVIHGDNVCNTLMEAASVCSLGQITGVLFEVGEQYRRSIRRAAINKA